MTTAEVLNLVAYAISAMATVLAALAALRSASSAKMAQESLIKEQLRSAEAFELERLRASQREVSNLVATCAFEQERIHFLAVTLRVLIQATAQFSGTTGGSREKLALDTVAKRVAKGNGAFDQAKQYSERPSEIIKLDAATLLALQITLPSHISTLRAIAEEMQLDTSTNHAQFLQLRQSAIR